MHIDVPPVKDEVNRLSESPEISAEVHNMSPPIFWKLFALDEAERVADDMNF